MSQALRKEIEDELFIHFKKAAAHFAKKDQPNAAGKLNRLVTLREQMLDGFVPRLDRVRGVDHGRWNQTVRATVDEFAKRPGPEDLLAFVTLLDSNLNTAAAA